MNSNKETENNNKNDDFLLKPENFKMELINFKDEVLKDLKNLNKSISEKNKKDKEELSEKLNDFYKKYDNFEIKLSELSKLIVKDRLDSKQIQDLLTFREKGGNIMTTNRVKIGIIEKETNDSIAKINKILGDTVIYPGLIGPKCKFECFHQMIDYILSQITLINDFKNRTQIEFSDYKQSIDKNLKAFKVKVDVLNNSLSQFTLVNIQESESKLMENINKIKNEIKNLKNEFINLNELYKTDKEFYDEGIKIAKIDLDNLKKENNDNKNINIENKNEISSLSEKFKQFNSLQISFSKSLEEEKEKIEKKIEKLYEQNNELNNNTNKIMLKLRKQNTNFDVFKKINYKLEESSSDDFDDNSKEDYNTIKNEKEIIKKDNQEKKNVNDEINSNDIELLSKNKKISKNINENVNINENNENINENNESINENDENINENLNEMLSQKELNNKFVHDIIRTRNFFTLNNVNYSKTKNLKYNNNFKNKEGKLYKKNKLKDKSSNNIIRIQKMLGIDLEDINAQLSSGKNSPRPKSNIRHFYNNDENNNYKYNSVKSFKPYIVDNNSNILYEQSPTENKYVINPTKNNEVFYTIAGDDTINRNNNMFENLLTKNKFSIMNTTRKFSNLNKNIMDNLYASSNSHKSDKHILKAFKLSKFPPPLNIAYNNNLLKSNTNNKNKESIFLSETNINKKLVSVNSELIKERQIDEIAKSMERTKRNRREKEKIFSSYQKDKQKHKIILGGSKLKKK